MKIKYSTLFVAASSWISKIVVVLTQLIVIRILLDKIGVDEYAVFALLMGLQGWFMLADMGTGLSIQNHISEALAANKKTDELVYFGRLVSLLLLFVTILILYIASPIIGPWFLRKLYVLPAKASNLFFLTGALYICAAISGVVYKIWYAERRGYLSNALPACAAAIGLIGVALISYSDYELTLISYVGIFIGPTAFLPLSVLIYQFINHDLLKRKIRINWANFKEIIKRSFSFWLFSVAAAFTLQIDYLIISQTLTSDEIALYSLMMKVFGVPFFIYTALLTAAWPAITEYSARRQWDKIRHYIHRGVVIGSGLLLFSTLGFIWFMRDLIRLIAPRQEFEAPVGLIVLMGMYWVLRTWTDTFAVVLQSMSKFKVLIILVPIQAVLSIAFQITLTPKFGVYGILMGLIGSFILTVSWWLPVSTYSNLKN